MSTSRTVHRVWGVCTFFILFSFALSGCVGVFSAFSLPAFISIVRLSCLLRHSQDELVLLQEEEGVEESRVPRDSGEEATPLATEGGAKT